MNTFYTAATKAVCLGVAGGMCYAQYEDTLRLKKDLNLKNKFWTADHFKDIAVINTINAGGIMMQS